ncbi:hypothetical protein ACIQI7_31990 [Kitasatospora sp. NPDC092039]|uniref:hypothetical protein n=1 Tax=Kitasatospora sp. NPDC092039 TaxID=3364086 RepID=UPI00381F4531
MGDHAHREPAAPASQAEARRLTGELCAAIEEVRSAVPILTARVRAAHRARVWTALGYGGWAAYAGAEFGVSRSTAYRLLDLAAAAEAIENTVTRQAGPQLSHAWDTGLVLPVRAVVELRGRMAELTDLIAERLADAQTEAGGAPLEPGRVGEIVAGAVAELRERPDVPVAELAIAGGPDGYDAEAWRRHVTTGRTLVAAQQRSDRALGEVALRLAPAHLCDRSALPVLTVYADDVGEDPELFLACRRYVITGDRRAVEDDYRGRRARDFLARHGESR